MHSLPLESAEQPASEFDTPYAYQFAPSRLAHALLRLAGWKLDFAGFPALQGVVLVYPHTSNWDAIVMFLAKSACGAQVQFWGKDTLFRVPLFGRWLRWFGGMPVKRTNREGIVQQAIELFAQRKAAGQYFWLGLAPEGTRKYIPGWRSGFYHTALSAQVPVCLLKLDYPRREINIRHFMRLSGDVSADMAHIACVYQGVQGLIPANMAPITLLDAAVPRETTIVR
jgi:1-acyl-sn-glycerol-3-phosphate acyltransferase